MLSLIKYEDNNYEHKFDKSSVKNCQNYFTLSQYCIYISFCTLDYIGLQSNQNYKSINLYKNTENITARKCKNVPEIFFSI